MSVCLIRPFVRLLKTQRKDRSLSKHTHKGNQETSVLIKTLAFMSNQQSNPINKVMILSQFNYSWMRSIYGKLGLNLAVCLCSY